MAFLIYDGDCPFCSRYVEFQMLRRRYPDIELLDARKNTSHAAVRTVRDRGLLIDEGMALVDGDKVLHGAEVMRFLASGQAHGILFRGNRLGALSYRTLKFGRDLVLRLLGRDKLGF